MRSAWNQASQAGNVACIASVSQHQVGCAHADTSDTRAAVSSVVPLDEETNGTENSDAGNTFRSEEVRKWHGQHGEVDGTLELLELSIH